MVRGGEALGGNAEKLRLKKSMGRTHDFLSPHGKGAAVENAGEYNCPAVPGTHLLQERKGEWQDHKT